MVWYLSGLTCTHANVTEKGEYRRACAELGLIFVAPDTSPRGADVPDDEAYDFGQGAGFYVDATQPPFDRQLPDGLLRHRRSCPELIAADFPADLGRQAITGHSMGGHGALTIALAQSRPLPQRLRLRADRRARPGAVGREGARPLSRAPTAPPGARTTRSR